MFAQLARTVLGDTDQSSLAKLQEAYKAQPYVAAVSPVTYEDSHSETEDFPQELLAMKEHLQVVVAQITYGLWRPYKKLGTFCHPFFLTAPLPRPLDT